jgi:hypothetical protein
LYNCAAPSTDEDFKATLVDSSLSTIMLLAALQQQQHTTQVLRCCAAALARCFSSQAVRLSEQLLLSWQLQIGANWAMTRLVTIL